MVLHMHFAVQALVALGMRAHDRLTVRIVAQMFAMEVLFEVAATGKGFQAISCREVFVAEAEDALSGFAFDGQGFRQIRR